MTDPRPLHILHLYPDEMSVYGDTGNVLALCARTRDHGFEPVVDRLTTASEALPTDVDLIIGGGGQDSGQSRIGTSLQGFGPALQDLVEDDVPVLLVCGMYQLFGRDYVTGAGTTVPGIGILDVVTRAGTGRRSNDILVTSPEFGELVGYENHSGLTVLGPRARPLGEVRFGSGNGDSGQEGVRYRNVVGTYIHGPLLPKNPAVADWMIEQAIRRRYGVDAGRPPVPRYTEDARRAAVRIIESER